MLAMVLLPVALFVWSRLRRGPSMSPEAARAGYEAAQAGAPLTKELIKAIAVHTALNAYRTDGVVEAVYSRDHYAVRLADGTPMRATRGHKLWARRVVLEPGERVSLLAVRGGDTATILWRL